MQDGASFLGRRANFNHACSLLSQYVKKGNSSFGDLNLTNSPNTGNIGSETIRQTRNSLPGMETSGTDVSDGNEMASRNNVNLVDLFPRHAGFGAQQGAKKTSAGLRPVSVTEPETAQMTIFYGGQVLVFDKFAAERAKEVIFLAGKTTTCSTQNGSTSTNDENIKGKTNNGMVPSSTNFISTNQNNSTQDQRPLPPRPHVSEIPIARKASLHRFLEKRKDRLSAKTPYINNSVLTRTEPMVENQRTWLGLSTDHHSSNFSDWLNQLQIGNSSP